MSKKKYGRYTVELSNENKIFFPENVTKGDLINYYENISEFMIPYLKNRPLMMHRFPNGIKGTSFYQKNASEYFPKWIKTYKVPLKEGNFTNYVICQNTATLIYLANQAMITPHIWLSQIPKLDYPDKLVFDLDPSTDDFKLVCKVALMLKDLLEELDLTPYIMTTGSHGLHVVVSLDSKSDFDTARLFATQCTNLLIQMNPDDITLQLRKEKRGKKVFIDTLRNQYGATSVAPYAVRARPNAPVATPLDWKELNDPKLTSQKYTIKDIFSKISKKSDPWQDFFKQKNSIKKVLEKLNKKIS